MSATAPPRPPSPDRPQTPRLDEPDAALIEEARRRARRRRAGYGAVGVAAAVAVSLLLALHGGGGRPTGHGLPPSLAGPSPASPGGRQGQGLAGFATPKIVGAAGLVAPGVGWAMNGLGLFWTGDDGVHWRLITPPDVTATGDAIARIVDIAYAGRGHIWVAASDIEGGAGLPRHSALERTSDGGRTWRSLTVPGCYACVVVAHLSVLDPLRGFALAGTRHRWRLYASHDGGATLNTVAIVPLRGPFVFSNARRGWGVGAGGQRLYGTVDGGRSWRRIELRPPNRYAGEAITVGVPRSFGRGRGVVPVRFRDRRTKAQHVVVYVTRDGGRTWAARPAPPSADVGAQTWGFPEALPFSAATAQDWVLLAGASLYATRDAGLSWSVVRPRHVPRAPHVWDLDFSSHSVGWAIFNATLVETQDGGRNWSRVGPARR